MRESLQGKQRRDRLTGSHEERRAEKQLVLRGPFLLFFLDVVGRAQKKDECGALFFKGEEKVVEIKTNDERMNEWMDGHLLLANPAHH